MQQVVSTVSQRLISIDRFEAAAELHEGIDNVEGAVKCYCMGGLFDKARALSRGIPSLNEYIEDRYNRHLVNSQNADELATRGHAFKVSMYRCHQIPPQPAALPQFHQMLTKWLSTPNNAQSSVLAFSA